MLTSGEGTDKLLQYSCLEEPGRLHAVHGVTKSQTQLSLSAYLHHSLRTVSEEDHQEKDRNSKLGVKQMAFWRV